MFQLQKEDRIILKKLICRDEKTLINFYRRYNKEIYYFIFKRINQKDKAEELTQDVFFDFIESLRDYRGECSIKNFLFSIAKNKLIDYLRKKKIKKILFSALPNNLIEGIASVILDEEMEKKELANKIKKVFDKLPNDYRIILRLKYIDGEKVKSIAQRLSLSFKAAESLLFRARKSFIKVFKSMA
ncbi:MAG: RNA polymerase sigma factor [Microgenomates group bacterium]|nr:RNA polymerase sigma factor [Microgenomates group bacterium]